MSHQHDQQEVHNLRALVDVPVVSGFGGYGYTRFDFKSPLEPVELETIERHYGDRIIMTTNNRQVYLRML